MAPDPLTAGDEVGAEQGLEPRRADLAVAADGPRPADGSVRWGIGDALLGTLLTLVVPGLVGVAVLVATGRESFAGIPLWGVALMQVPLWAGLLGAPLWSSYLKGRRSLVADFGLRMRPSDIALGLLAGFVGQFALGLILQLVYRSFDVDVDRVGQAAEELADSATDPVGVVLLILVVAVAAPVLEELFYRGLWLRAVARRFGSAAGVITSSLVFGALHFQPYDFPALAGFGLLAALLTVKTGRLGPAIWAHVAFNLTAVVSLLST